MNQDILRQQVKIAKALNPEYSYKDFAGYLNITNNSFYNWLARYYDLSSNKAIQLEDIIINLIE